MDSLVDSDVDHIVSHIRKAVIRFRLVDERSLEVVYFASAGGFDEAQDSCPARSGRVRNRSSHRLRDQLTPMNRWHSPPRCLPHVIAPPLLVRRSQNIRSELLHI